MKRLGQVMIGLLLGTALTAQAAQAQSSDQVWSAQVDAAATFGHSSASAFGGEVDRRLGPSWDVVLEAGRMGNVTSSAVQSRADIIGNSIGATANPVQSAVYYDLGLRYHLMPNGKWNPYVTAGFGGARVKTGTTFSQNGAQLTDAQLSADLVALGADLAGTINKPFMLLGGGVSVPVKARYFLDGSLRYGMIFPRTSQIDNDKRTNTLRLQLGLGVRF
jgi:opacity protein-like surface antigen